MSRKAVVHTPSSLFALADDIKDAGGTVEEVARELKASKVPKISVSHQAKIDHALEVIPIFVNEVRSKILKGQVLVR